MSARSWSARLQVARYAVLAACAGVLAVGRALDGEWWWFALTALVSVWALAAGLGVFRRRRVDPRSPAGRAAEQAAASVEWTPPRLRELAASRGLGTTTSSERIALVKALREADPRLGLVTAKNLVDALG